MTISKPKLDIFDVLSSIDKRDFDYLSRQNDDLKKSFAHLVAMRWASSIQDGDAAQLYLWLINERVNLNFWELGSHPELLYKLMATCGLGVKQRHDWLAMPKKKESTHKLHEFLSTFWPEANDLELTIIINQFTDDTFIDFVNTCGCTPDTAKEAIKAYDNYFGKKTKKKGKQTRQKA